MFLSEISVVSAFILSALLFTIYLHVSCLRIGEYFPGNMILCVCNVPCVPLLVFGLAVCISGRFFLEFDAVILSLSS